jgi:hypothetical protein
LKASLEVLKLKEIQLERDFRTDKKGCAVEMTAGIIGSLMKKFKYEKHKILIDWLEVLGFDNLDGRLTDAMNEEDLRVTCS